MLSTPRRDEEFSAVVDSVPIAFGLSQLKSMREAAMKAKGDTDICVERAQLDRQIKIPSSAP